MLTIGELARYAGVTVRTVRHYHQVGLLAEPPRDELGHRRYDAAALLRLQHLVALADAGVPLRRIPQVLDAGPSERAGLIDALDADLGLRQERLARTRERLARLRTDSGPASPPGLDALEAGLVEIGVPADRVAQEHEMWLLSHALYPELTAQWIRQETQLQADAEYCALYRDASAINDWEPDDPRIAELAARNVAWTLSHVADYQQWNDAYQSDPRASALLEAHYRHRYQTPAHRRLQQLVTAGLAAAQGSHPQ